jgi:TAP-like protein
MFLDRVRAMVLDAIVDPVRYSKSAESRLAMFTEPVDEVLGRSLSLCESAGPERCALAGGDQSPAERWERLLARAKRGPIPAPNANLHGVARDRLSYSDLLISVRNGLFDPATWPQNASDLDAAVRGDGSALESAASSIRSPTGWATGTVQAAITCADGPARQGPGAWPQVFKRLKRNSTLAGAYFFAAQWAPCASWPVRAQDAYRGPWNASTPNPILLINQTQDPATFYGNAVRAEKLLGNAVLLTHEGYGHIFFHDPSACVDKAIADYLTELITPPPGTVCQSDHLPFDLDFG